MIINSEVTPQKGIHIALFILSKLGLLNFCILWNLTINYKLNYFFAYKIGEGVLNLLQIH